MMIFIRIMSAIAFGLLLFQDVQAKTCFNTNDIGAEIINSGESKNGELDEIRIWIKGNKKQYITVPLLEYVSLKDVLEFRDIDFNGQKEVIIKYDNDSSHSTLYSVMKVDCNRLIPHPVIQEMGIYEVDNKKKELISYFKDGFRTGEKKYCFPKGYLCYESLALTEQIAFIKEYNKKGEVIRQRAVNIEQPLLNITFQINKKAYLHKSLNKSTKMYLIKGDKVTLLDEKTDSSGQKWYFINYKGKKDLNMWIKAEAVDIEPVKESIEKSEPEAKQLTPKEPVEITKQTPVTTPPKNAEITKIEKPEPIEKSASGSISLTFLASFLGLLAWRVS